MDDELRFLDILEVLTRHEVEFVVVGGDHRAEVIFLAGLPDIAESRPHSRVNNP